MKRLVIKQIVRFLRWYFIGKMMYRIGNLDGQRVVLNYGKIVGLDGERAQIIYLENGHSIKDARRIHLQRLRYDGRLKAWVYYD